MTWAALAAWLLTVGGGSALFLTWLRHGGLESREGIRPATLFSHAGLALAGLALWVAFVVTGRSLLGWLAVGSLAVVALIGVVMLVGWLRGRNKRDHTTLPAEAAFPLPVVAAHGLLAGVTVLLSVLAAAGVG